MRIVSKGLSYTYNKNTPFASEALKDVSLTIDEGEFFGIIGHTGSGKSTFIQHLNGLVPLERGMLTVGDFNLKKYTKKEYKAIRTPGEIDGICFENGKKLSYRKYCKAYLNGIKKLRAKVGMVFQYPEYQLFGETVFADVAFGVKNFFPDYAPEGVERAVKNAIEAVGLDYKEVKDKSPFELSGGQKRRVAIAGVIVTKPEVLILDEPLAGLDPQGKTELTSLLHSLHERDVKTIVIVSHDMDDVCENCTKAAVFSSGKIIDCAPPERLFKNPQVLAEKGVEEPVTVYLSSMLEKIGVSLNTDYKTDDFINKLTEFYDKSRKTHVK